MEKQKTGFTTVVEETNNKMQSIEAFRNKPISGTPQKIGFFVLVTAGLLLASMFVLQILTGVFALVVAGIATVALWFGWNFVRKLDPLIQQKTKNMVLNRMIEEARRNAKAQLDNQVIDRHNKLAAAKVARDKMGALVKSMKDKLEATDPSSSSFAKMTGILATIEKAYATVLTNLDMAAKSNKEFENKVQEYKDLDDFTTMAGDAMAVFDSTSGSKLQDMLSLEAFKHIDFEFNTAITTIENSARDLEL